MIKEFIFIYAKKGVMRVKLADILFVECYRFNMRIFCTNQVYDLRMSLGNLQSKLPPGKFLRIHRSYLIAVDHIGYYQKGIVYMGDYEIPVQKGKVGQFKASLNMIN